MESKIKQRSFPPAVPLKINKLLEYQYFASIYQKYDCNFFRQILPYFSQILTTDKLELLKFIYVPIQNINKVPKIQIGLPFIPQNGIQNPHLYELTNEVTFIKIAYQVHIIFQYLINLNMMSIGIRRMKFQDKFWLFTEGLIKSYCYSEIVYKKDDEREKSILFILQGEFKCMNRQNKSFKTISKGYAIDTNGNLKKLKFQQKQKKSFNKNQSPILEKKNIDKKDGQQIEQFEEELHSLWSYSNNSKILVVSLSIIKKYSLFQDQSVSGRQTPKIPNQKPTNKLQIKAGIQNIVKQRRIKTQKQQNTKSNLVRKNYSLSKRPNLFSSRTTTLTKDPFLQIHIQQIYDNQIVKSYTKQNQLYHRMKKILDLKKNKKNIIKTQQKAQIPSQTKSHLFPFFKQQLTQEKQKINLKRRKTKQLWGNGTINYQGKQNYFRKSQQFASQLSNQMLKTSNSQESKLRTLKPKKSELSSFYLLKRNLYNKEYHKGNSFQLNG